jgi:hypothetical protein
LTRCLWTEKIQNRYCLAFWDELKRCRESFEETMELDITIQAGEFPANLGQQQPLFGDLNPAIAEARPLRHSRARRLTPLTSKFADPTQCYSPTQR